LSWKARGGKDKAITGNGKGEMRGSFGRIHDSAVDSSLRMTIFRMAIFRRAIFRMCGMSEAAF
jgi:hypothetical protein